LALPLGKSRNLRPPKPLGEAEAIPHASGSVGRNLEPRPKGWRAFWGGPGPSPTLEEEELLLLKPEVVGPPKAGHLPDHPVHHVQGGGQAGKAVAASRVDAA